MDGLSTFLSVVSRALRPSFESSSGNERKGRPMEKTRINGARMGHQASRLVSDARELAQTSVDEGKAFVSRKAIPFMIGTFIVGLCMGVDALISGSRGKVTSGTWKYFPVQDQSRRNRAPGRRHRVVQWKEGHDDELAGLALLAVAVLLLVWGLEASGTIGSDVLPVLSGRSHGPDRVALPGQRRRRSDGPGSPPSPTSSHERSPCEAGGVTIDLRQLT